MKWFSLKGIKEEMSKVHYPTVGSLAKSSTIAILFTVAFVIFFIGCDFLAATFFRYIGL